MKKLFILSIAILFAVVSFAQRVYTPALDTLNDNEAVNFATMEVTDYYDAISFQALCTNLGGVSDGDLIFQGSVDGTSWKDMIPQTDRFIFNPDNDTLTITDGAIYQITVFGTPYRYYRFRGQGTDNDTTIITFSYSTWK